MDARDVVVTGGTGRIGMALCPALAARGHRIVSFDRRPVDTPRPGIAEVVGDLADADALDRHLVPGGALVHLAGALDAEDWDALEATNVTATRRLFDRAAARGVTTIVHASSIHAGGYAPVDARFDGVDRYAADSPYGVSKRFGETALELLAHRHPLAGYALRIGTCRAVPLTRRERTTWLSPADAARLVDACLRHDGTGYRRLWAFSANRDADIDRAAWAAIGYAPQDDAADHAATLEDGRAADGAGFGLIGGRFVRARDQPA